MQVWLSSLKLYSAFIHLIPKLTRKDVEVPDTLIVSVIDLLIPFNTSRSNLSNRYRVIIQRILKMFQRAGKNTGSPSYLPLLKEWTVFQIYILLKEKAVENANYHFQQQSTFYIHHTRSCPSFLNYCMFELKILQIN